MASLPNKTFLCNYNARDFVAATNTIPNASGAIFNEDLVLNQAPSAVNDTYLTIQEGCYFSKSFSSASANPFNRSGNEALTIVAKTSVTDNNNGNLLANRQGMTMNWMFRQDEYGKVYVHTSVATTPKIVVTTTSANTYSFIISNGKYEGVSYTDNVSSETATTSYGGASNLIQIFTSTQYNEPWKGNFYWIYVSPEVLTDEEIRQVISYNDSSIGVSPNNVELSKAGDSVQVTVESETDWTASTNDSWYTFTPTTGTSATTGVTITVPANYTSVNTGTLSFINENQDTADVTISQGYIAKPTNLRNIYIGTTSANKMYVGDDLVYKKITLTTP